MVPAVDLHKGKGIQCLFVFSFHCLFEEGFIFEFYAISVLIVLCKDRLGHFAYWSIKQFCNLPSLSLCLSLKHWKEATRLFHLWNCKLSPFLLLKIWTLAWKLNSAFMYDCTISKVNNLPARSSMLYCHTVLFLALEIILLYFPPISTEMIVVKRTFLIECLSLAIYPTNGLLVDLKI